MKRTFLTFIIRCYRPKQCHTMPTMKIKAGMTISPGERADFSRWCHGGDAGFFVDQIGSVMSFRTCWTKVLCLTDWTFWGFGCNMLKCDMWTGEEMDYGPNGGLVFAMEYLSENMNWLEAWIHPNSQLKLISKRKVESASQWQRWKEYLKT